VLLEKRGLGGKARLDLSASVTFKGTTSGVREKRGTTRMSAYAKTGRVLISGRAGKTKKGEVKEKEGSSEGRILQ